MSPRYELDEVRLTLWLNSDEQGLKQSANSRNSQNASNISGIYSFIYIIDQTDFLTTSFSVVLYQFIIFDLYLD